MFVKQTNVNKRFVLDSVPVRAQTLRGVRNLIARNELFHRIAIQFPGKDFKYSWSRDVPRGSPKTLGQRVMHLVPSKTLGQKVMHRSTIVAGKIFSLNEWDPTDLSQLRKNRLHNCTNRGQQTVLPIKSTANYKDMITSDMIISQGQAENLQRKGEDGQSLRISVSFHAQVKLSIGPCPSLVPCNTVQSIAVGMFFISWKCSPWMVFNALESSITRRLTQDMPKLFSLLLADHHRMSVLPYKWAHRRRIYGQFFCFTFHVRQMLLFQLEVTNKPRKWCKLQSLQPQQIQSRIEIGTVCKQ